jgi:hypothetical protein
LHQQENFSLAMKEDIEDFKYDPPGHLSEEALVNYQCGRLDEVELEKVQFHLLQCDRCLAVFNDVKDFFEPRREDEEAINRGRIEREWLAFRDRVDVKEEAESRAPGRHRRRFWSSPALTLALAASLLILLGLTTVWMMNLRKQNRVLAGQLEAEQKSWADRVKELEEENRILQEQVGTAERNTPPRQNPEAQRADLRQPALNVPIYDLYSLQSVRRSADPEQVNRIKIPSAASSLVLILNGESQSNDSDYAIEIANPTGKVIWRGRGLKRNGYGNFTLTLERTFLSRGTYRLKLYGQGGQPPHLVAEYVLQIE